jgi:probable phosphoglycerate mutase
MSISEVTVYTDGASRGNPGPAAIAFVVQVDGQTISEYGTRIGQATNNTAEYLALIRGLEFVDGLGAKRVHIRSDSELMVRQMRGEYRVKHPDLIPLNEQAQVLARRFAAVTYTHVPRAENAEADRLCNEALDGRSTPIPEIAPTISPAPPSPRSRPSTTPPHSKTELRKEAIVELLGDVRESWLKSGGARPSIEEVSEKIQSILSNQPKRRSSAKISARRTPKPTT